ncbi:hypothetical protein [Serratia liquefaciens]|uniref:hypothetical protein n=1 Tax=Serratia liquefaciens TaxID=614 RepID=UPI00165D2C46|nr:hypothetical protein [Serratia liquefaciens]QNQ52337.1 hypothetical protein IAI46_13805 [Serratia liquefaciens]
MNKLSELSKPVAWTDSDAVDILKAGEWAPAFPEKYQDSFPLYSQEYVSALLADIEYMRWRIKEMDLLFGGMLLTMQAAVIEAEHGEGPNIAMEWIINKLMGPGEFAPHSEKDAQAYFNRESEKIDAEYSKVMEFYKQRREAEKEQNNG